LKKEERMKLSDDDTRHALETGQTLELDLPRRHNYLPANYHVWINRQRQFTCDVKYSTEADRRKPFAASAEWAEFLSQLPPVCRDRDEWVVL